MTTITKPAKLLATIRRWLQTAVAAFTSIVSTTSVSFTDTSILHSNTITRRLWSFGDGSTSALQNPTHIYLGAGDFTVTLTLTDSAGRTSSKSAVVTITATSMSTLSITPTGIPTHGGGLWSATLSGPPGAQIHLFFVVNAMAPSGIELRDNAIWNGAAWIASVGNVGIKSSIPDLNPGWVFLVELEGALSMSTILSVVSGDVNPSRSINPTLIASIDQTGTLV